MKPKHPYPAYLKRLAQKQLRATWTNVTGPIAPDYTLQRTHNLSQYSLSLGTPLGNSSGLSSNYYSGQLDRIESLLRQVVGYRYL